jgi:hypothetical protein
MRINSYIDSEDFNLFLQGKTAEIISATDDEIKLKIEGKRYVISPIGFEAEGFEIMDYETINPEDDL